MVDGSARSETTTSVVRFVLFWPKFSVIFSFFGAVVIFFYDFDLATSPPRPKIIFTFFFVFIRFNICFHFEVFVVGLPVLLNLSLQISVKTTNKSQSLAGNGLWRDIPFGWLSHTSEFVLLILPMANCGSRTHAACLRKKKRHECGVLHANGNHYDRITKYRIVYTIFLFSAASSSSFRQRCGMFISYGRIITKNFIIKQTLRHIMQIIFYCYGFGIERGIVRFGTEISCAHSNVLQQLRMALALQSSFTLRKVDTVYEQNEWDDGGGERE